MISWKDIVILVLAFAFLALFVVAKANKVHANENAISVDALLNTTALEVEGVPEALVQERQRYFENPSDMTLAKAKDLRARWEAAMRDREATEAQYRELREVVEDLKTSAPEWVAQIHVKLAGNNRLSRGEVEDLMAQSKALKQAQERDALRALVARVAAADIREVLPPPQSNVEAGR